MPSGWFASTTRPAPRPVIANTPPTSNSSQVSSSSRATIGLRTARSG
jgi:hypothetical protein